MRVEIHGIDAVLKNLDKEIGNIIARSTRGLIKCQNLLQNKAMPLTPIKTGNLRRSYYKPAPITTISGTVVAIVENQAEYAVRVHEMPDPRKYKSKLTGDVIDVPVNWSAEGTGNKFLERPLFENVDKFLKLIAEG